MKPTQEQINNAITTCQVLFEAYQKEEGSNQEYYTKGIITYSEHKEAEFIIFQKYQKQFGIVIMDLFIAPDSFY